MTRFLWPLLLLAGAAILACPPSLQAQFRFTPEDSARLAKQALREADSLKKAEAAKKLAPARTAADSAAARTTADSAAARKPAPPSSPASTAKTVERQTAPHAKKNMPRVKDSTATKR
jgi:hypothetical protein